MPEDLILEHLRAIRTSQANMQGTLEDVVYRMASVEQQVAGLRADLAHYSARQDQFEQRMRRVERRLELETPP